MAMIALAWLLGAIQFFATYFGDGGRVASDVDFTVWFYLIVPMLFTLSYFYDKTVDFIRAYKRKREK